MMSPPSVVNAYHRRHWLLVTNVVENILFSAILLGWPAFVSILKNEGFYAHLCTTTTIDSRSPKAAASTLYDITLVNLSRSQPSVEMIIAQDPPPASGDWLPTEDCCPLKEKKNCSEQDKAIHNCFTLGAFLMNSATIPIVWAVNKIGSKRMRCFGAIIVGAAMIVFACCSPHLSYLLVYACALVVLGGNIIAYTSLQIANLFGPTRALSLGLLVGSYAASAIVFPALKVFYALGVPLHVLFLTMAAMTPLVIINSCLTIPDVAIPSVTELSQIDEMSVDSPSVGECKPIFLQNRKVSYDSASRRPSFGSSSSQMKKRDSSDEVNVIPFHRVVYMPIFLWSLIVVAITQLRLVFFVGELHQMLSHITFDDVETIDLYIFIFGVLQICCLGTTYFIGGFVDWRNKKVTNSSTAVSEEPQSMISGDVDTRSVVRPQHTISSTATPTAVVFAAKHEKSGEITSTTVPLALVHSAHRIPAGATPTALANIRKSPLKQQTKEGSDDNNSPPSQRRDSHFSASAKNVQSGAKIIDRKISKLKDCAVVFFVTSTLTVIFGLLVLIPSLTIQISSFVCYTLIRGFVPCAVGRLYAIAFHSLHHQSLMALAFAVSAVVSLVQQPLFTIVTNECDRDPYWVNVALLLLSLLVFGLPLHLLFHCKRLQQWGQKSAVSIVVQPVTVKMQYLDSKLHSRGTAPTEL